MLLILLAFVSFLSTLFGGLLALRFRKFAHIMLAFTAGVLIALTAFHLIPEILEIAEQSGYGLQYPIIAMLLGFFGSPD